MKRLYLCLSLFTLPGLSLLSAQVPGQELHLIGQSGEILDISPTFDGGVVASGFYLDNLGYANAFLMRFDSSANLLWAKGYDFSNDDRALTVQQTPDSGFVLAGKAVNGLGAEDMLLFKTQANGDLQWGRQYGGTDTDWGRFALVDPFGGYLLGGGTNSMGPSTDVLLIKTDLSGNIQWSSTYGGNAIDEVYTGVVSTETGYFFGGHSFSSTLSQEGFVLSLDLFLNFKWATLIPDNGFGRVRQLALKDTVSYVLQDYNSAGAPNPDILISRLDPAGIPAESHLIASPDFQQCRDFIPDGSGGWLITGLYRESNSDNRPFFVRLDSLWQVNDAWGYGSTESDLANSISSLGGSGNLVMGGLSEGFRPGTTDPAPYLLSAYANGNTGCNDLPLSFTSDTLTLSYLQPSLVITPNPGTQVYLSTGTTIDLMPSIQQVCSITAREGRVEDAWRVWPVPADERVYVRMQEGRTLSPKWIDALGKEVEVPFTQGADWIFEVGEVPAGWYYFTPASGVAPRKIWIRH